MAAATSVTKPSAEITGQSIPSGTAIVPTKMSYVNAWYALYTCLPFNNLVYDDAAEESEAVSTSQKVAQYFVARYPLYYMDCEGGKVLKVYFQKFPELDVEGYDALYGAGAAQVALDNYNKVPPRDRFDKNDSYQFSALKQDSVLGGINSCALNALTSFAAAIQKTSRLEKTE